MRIEQILQVLEIAKTGNMSKAAENLYISQPNLSISLKRLEEEIGRQIFTRTPKGLYLSDFGREFIKYANAMDRDYENIKAFSRFSERPPLRFSAGIAP